jgi:hypothetical protein
MTIVQFALFMCGLARDGVWLNATPEQKIQCYEKVMECFRDYGDNTVGVEVCYRYALKLRGVFR